MMERGADISECGRYRFTLWRIWNPDLPIFMFLGLNPSTADASLDDPTIRRCAGFVKDWGGGGFYMMNLFAFRATDPADMKKEPEPVGFLNTQWLREVSRRCDKVIFCWGTHGIYRGRDKEVAALFPIAMCLEKTKHGHPKHPLYLRSDTVLEPYFIN